MKTSGTGRVLAVLFIGTIAGICIHFRQLREVALGKDFYLSVQARHFDSIVAYHSTITMIIAGVILAVLAFGVYELIAWGFTRMIPPSEIEE